MANTIQIRRGTAAALISTNPTLAAGEPCFETDTGKVKIGDGSTAWTSLAYKAGDVSGPASSTADAFALYNGTGGKTLKDSATTKSIDGTFATNSDSLIPTEKATKTYIGSAIGAATIDGGVVS